MPRNKAQPLIYGPPHWFQSHPRPPFAPPFANRAPVNHDGNATPHTHAPSGGSPSGPIRTGRCGVARVGCTLRPTLPSRVGGGGTPSRREMGVARGSADKEVSEQRGRAVPYRTVGKRRRVGLTRVRGAALALVGEGSALFRSPRRETSRCPHLTRLAKGKLDEIAKPRTVPRSQQQQPGTAHERDEGAGFGRKPECNSSTHGGRGNRDALV